MASTLIPTSPKAPAAPGAKPPLTAKQASAALMQVVRQTHHLFV